MSQLQLYCYVAVLVSAYAISLPVIIYVAHQLYVDWNKYYIIKRYRWIILWSIVFAALQILWQIPFKLTMHYLEVDEKRLSIVLQFLICLEWALMMTARTAFFTFAVLVMFLLHLFIFTESKRRTLSICLK